jgi:hypothetical protein
MQSMLVRVLLAAGVPHDQPDEQLQQHAHKRA